jgi:hypothetical protein
MKAILPDPRVPARTHLTRLFIKFAQVLPVGFITLYLALAIAFVMRGGGLENYVRVIDSMPTLAAAQMIVDGQGTALYDLETQREAHERFLAPYRQLHEGELLPFVHPPLEAFISVPLLSFGYAGGTLGWQLLTVFAFVAALVLLQRTLPIYRSWLPVFVLYIFSYHPVFRAFFLGQTSPLVFLGVCLTYASMRRSGNKWDFCAGIGLVLASLKLQVLPVLVLLVIIEGRWKAIFWFGAQMLALVVAMMPVLGVMWPLRFIDILGAASEWSSLNAINPAIMHNWRGFATNIAGSLAMDAITPLTALLSFSSLLIFLFMWWQSRIVAGLSTQNWTNAKMLLWAHGLLTAILIAPHLNPHDLTLMIFPAWVILFAVQSGNLPRWLSVVWLSLLGALYFVMAAVFGFGANTSLWVVPNVLLLAFGTLLLVVTMRNTQTENKAQSEHPAPIERPALRV